MQCPGCHADNPESSHYCHHCGTDLRSGEVGRRHAFAARPDEPVASFALVSTIMPRGAGTHPQTYKLAFGIALVAALVCAIFGAVPMAIVLAAFAIPIVYVVYLYDVNLWKDQPVQVVLSAFLVTAALATLFTVLWTRLWPIGGGALAISEPSPSIRDLLVVAVLVPIVAMILMQIGPAYLASRPQFDDLIDGLTFGVVAGVAYAALETIVLNADVLTGGGQGSGDPALWLSLVFAQGFVKPLVYGTAAGLAGAEFSGLGKGYDGFTGRYFRAVAFAMAMLAVYQGGVYLLGFVGRQPMGQILGMAWGLLLLAVLILRVRTVLHVGLLEAALKTRAVATSGSTDAVGYCPQCEMPLVVAASFCSVCGVSLAAKGVVAQTSGSTEGSESQA